MGDLDRLADDYNAMRRERDEACEELEVLRGLIEGETWAGAVLRRERDAARAALGEAWMAGGVSLADGIRRKTAALEKLR